MREIDEEGDAPKQSLGIVPTAFVTRGPTTVPRVDYERIFVLDDAAELLGEYVLRDDSAFEYSDLKRSIPINGLRHLATFYQGEYAFTPFRVDPLWFVLLTRGVPRIEDRGGLGTLLAAARIHIPSAIEPAVANRERDLRERERLIEAREAEVAKREEHVSQLDLEAQIASMKLKELEAGVRAREARLDTLRDYALEMQRSFVAPKPAPAEERKGKDPEPEVAVPR